MNLLIFLFAFEFGYTPNIRVLQYEPSDCYYELIMYTELECEIFLFNFIFCGGGVRTYITPHNSFFNYAPNTTVYDFKFGLRFKGLEIGGRHRCFHPTFPYLPFYKQELKGLEGSFDELYIRLTNKQ